jgi:subtilase family serine protease
LRVSFILKARNASQLAAEVEAGFQGPYLGVGQFAQEFGQTPQYVNELVSYLRQFGIRAEVLPDMLDVETHGQAVQYEKALSILEEDFIVKEGPTNQLKGSKPRLAEIYGSKKAPELPADLAQGILAILGLSNYAPFESLAVPGQRPTSLPPGVKPADLAPFMQLPQAFEADYNLTPLEDAGYLGQGQTMAIVTLASMDPSVAYTFWRSYANVPVLSHRLTIVKLDGGAGPVSLSLGSDETTLDVEQSGTIAPQAKIVVYQAPNTDYGFVDAFYTAARQNIAGSISPSWGESETAIQAAVDSGTESPAYAEAFDQAFMESAVQGQSVFVASGDQGAYDATADVGTTNLAVDNPSDSAFDTSVGGTTLPGEQVYPLSSGGYETVTIPSQITWAWDYLWPLYKALGSTSESSLATSLVVGSGGGYSSDFPRPSCQEGIGASSFADYQYLTGIDPEQVAPGLIEPTQFSFNPQPVIASGVESTGRVLPDVAFNADPQTGYAVYDPQFQPVFGSSVEDFGGTSFIGPQLNGVDAVYESALSTRIGFWNPQIYGFAKGANSPFTPLDSSQVFGSSYFGGEINGQPIQVEGEFVNGNDFYTGRSGAIYNPGSGLGYANLFALYHDFASNRSK